MNETEFEITVSGQKVHGTYDHETGEVDVGDVCGMDTREINVFVAAVRNEHAPHLGERYLYQNL